MAGNRKKTRMTARPEHLNRGLAVTDKIKSAWQKRAIRCKVGAMKSVCREWPRVALAARMGRVYRLRVNRSVQAYQVERKDLERIRTAATAVD